jgi:hypothetical protein
MLIAAIGTAFLISSADATTIDLYEYALNIDGDTYFPFMGDALPASVDATGFDETSGLGDIVITLPSAGAHQVLAFFDHEIDETTNTFFNESGEAVGSAASGQSWEIDEPGYIFGDIYDNFLMASLDGTNGVPAGWEDDVSMAMGWDFSLFSGQIATITFSLGTMVPDADFYLIHSDPDSLFASESAQSIYLSSRLAIVPEPGTLWLLGSGLLLMFSLRRERRA